MSERSEKERRVIEAARAYAARFEAQHDCSPQAWAVADAIRALDAPVPRYTVRVGMAYHFIVDRLGGFECARVDATGMAQRIADLLNAAEPQP